MNKGIEEKLRNLLESNITHLMHEENFKFVKHDISQPIFFDEPIDVMMHLASRA
jgi:hypothetical protein